MLELGEFSLLVTYFPKHYAEHCEKSDIFFLLGAHLLAGKKMISGKS